MKKSYVLVLDSGIGGVSILKSLKSKFLQQSFIYVADNSIAPYGDKTKTFLRQHILTLINKYMSKYSIKLIVFACNTVTATTINFIREKVNIPIVGTEPPVKQVKNNKKTLVLATKGTIKYSKLLKHYKNNKNFTFVPLKNIATYLDEQFFNRNRIINSLKQQIPKQKYKNVVLGCTHYYFLKSEIATILYGKIKFYDAINGVVKRVDSLLEKSMKRQKQTIKIFTTKNNGNLKKLIWHIVRN